MEVKSALCVPVVRRERLRALKRHLVRESGVIPQRNALCNQWLRKGHQKFFTSPVDIHDPYRIILVGIIRVVLVGGYYYSEDI